MQYNIIDTYSREYDGDIYEFEFKYYYWSGDYMQPPEDDLEILKVYKNEEDITGNWKSYIDSSDIEQEIVDNL